MSEGGVRVDPREQIDALAADLLSWGVRRVHVLAWRDLDDPDAGGSELHADQFMRRWSDAGLDVVHRTSHALGQPEQAQRNGYRVVRRGSRYSVFPRSVTSEVLRGMGPRDAVVEVWNGVPWFTPVWCRGPRMVMFHHVHGPMWDQLFGARLAGFGRALEARIGPRFYRGTELATPCAATRDSLVGDFGLRPERVTVVANGTDDFWSPGAEAKAPVPTVVGCGRLAPVKRFDVLLEQAALARQQVPDLQLVVVGDGPMRVELDAWVAAHDAGSWVRFAGSASNETLRDLYRQAWLVASASIAEGWGLTLTEAASCGTPAVATDVGGHRCSVVDGATGVLTQASRLGDEMAALLLDHRRRDTMAAAALVRSRCLTWDATAAGLLTVLHRDAQRRTGNSSGTRRRIAAAR